MKKFVLGSTSPIKIEALKRACIKIGLDTNVVGIEAESGVHNQPMGLAEISKGALNRVMAARKHDPTAVAIGIENGISIISATLNIEYAVILLIAPDGTHFVGSSEGISFPAEAIEMSRKTGFTTTVGQCIAEKAVSDPTDPHAFLTNNHAPRIRLLENALVTLLARALPNLK